MGKIKMTFENWCRDNNHQDYLDLWDYDLNNCSPSEIGFGVGKKFYFKCKNGIHESEEWRVDKLTSVNIYGNPHTTISCRKCNSIGQYLADNNELSIWSSKNEIDPFTVTKMNSNKKYYLICPDCGSEKLMPPSNFVNRGLCCTCGDGQSYPNKFVYAFLSQLNIEFETEKTFDWVKDKRYDVYIPKFNYIIENHGGQHYKKSGRGKSLEEEQENDRFKEQLSRDNGMEQYIVLDCRKSDLEWIKDSIMKSSLPSLLEFKEDDIDWIKCGEYAEKNLVKEVCDYWNNKKDDETANDLGRIFNVDRSTIIAYLKKGTKLDWCEYDAKEEIRKSNAKNGGHNRKPISCDGQIFSSLTECAKYYDIKTSTMSGYLSDKYKMSQRFVELGLKYI